MPVTRPSPGLTVARGDFTVPRNTAVWTGDPTAVVRQKFPTTPARMRVKTDHASTNAIIAWLQDIPVDLEHGARKVSSYSARCYRTSEV